MIRFLFLHRRQYIGDHIKCIFDGKIPEAVINSFCFFTPTFTVVSWSMNERFICLTRMADIWYLFECVSIRRCVITMKHCWTPVCYRILALVIWFQARKWSAMPTTNGSHLCCLDRPYSFIFHTFSGALGKVILLSNNTFDSVKTTPENVICEKITYDQYQLIHTAWLIHSMTFHRHFQ